MENMIISKITLVAVKVNRLSLRNKPRSRNWTEALALALVISPYPSRSSQPLPYMRRTATSYELINGDVTNRCPSHIHRSACKANPNIQLINSHNKWITTTGEKNIFDKETVGTNEVQSDVFGLGQLHFSIGK